MYNIAESRFIIKFKLKLPSMINFLLKVSVSNTEANLALRRISMLLSKSAIAKFNT